MSTSWPERPRLGSDGVASFTDGQGPYPQRPPTGRGAPSAAGRTRRGCHAVVTFRRGQKLPQIGAM